MKTNLIPIQTIEDPRLQLYTKLSEKELLYLHGARDGVFIAESPKVIGRALAAGYEPLSFLIEEKELKGEAGALLASLHDVEIGTEMTSHKKTTREKSEEEPLEIPVYCAPQQLLQDLTGFPMTRGALCAMRRKDPADPVEFLKKCRRVVLLNDVENPTNVGAIFRSAAALGMDGVLLSKGCADPLYRRAARVSMGTVFQIPWTYAESEIARQSGTNGESGSYAKTTDSPVHLLKEQGFTTVAMALKENSLSVEDERFRKAGRLAVVMGAEGEGLPEEVISSCDYTAMIPMSREVDSLNVAAAAAVAFWAVAR